MLICAVSDCQGASYSWHDLEQIPDCTLIGDFEDGRVRVLVVSDHGPSAFHSNKMLDRAGDADDHR